jgi:hypothetical protein
VTRSASRSPKCTRRAYDDSIKIVVADACPALRAGWRAAPLRGKPGRRWLVWDNQRLRVAIVISAAGPKLCAALWTAGYDLRLRSDTYEVWASRRV